MTQSPGHREHPEHQVRENRLSERKRVELNGQVLADSTDVIEVAEDGYPPRYYFPRSDVKTELLQRSSTTTRCPFKGTANYYGVNVDGARLDDAAWTYEQPYDEHRALASRIAFDEDKSPDLQVVSSE